jgi:soluble lytic murein transglycosylase-like protein
MNRLIVIAAVFATFRANAFCFEEAGREYNVNPMLLAAIAQVESSMQHRVLNETHFARTKTIDIGLMQINSGALKQLNKEGITKEMLISDPCLNVRVGARILAEKFKKEGPGWEGVGAYNAACVQLKGEACRKARDTYTTKVWLAMNSKLQGKETKSSPQANTLDSGPDKRSSQQKNSRIISIEIASLESSNND